LPSLVPELTGENKKIYERRTNAGVTRIVLGAWKEADKRAAHDFLDQISRRVHTTKCSPETGLSQGIAGYFDYPAIAFHTRLFPSRDGSSEGSSTQGRRVSIKKVYTYQDGYLVTVWLQRVGDGDPSTRHLSQLLRQQLR